MESQLYKHLQFIVMKRNRKNGASEMRFFFGAATYVVKAYAVLQL